MKFPAILVPTSDTLRLTWLNHGGRKLLNVPYVVDIKDYFISEVVHNRKMKFSASMEDIRS